MSTQLPSSSPRHFLHVGLGNSFTKTIPFLVDGGATPSCISLQTLEAALACGSISKHARPPLKLFTADGNSMAATESRSLRLTLSDGFSFTTPVQVVPELPYEGLLGNNVISSLNLVVDHTDSSVKRVPLGQVIKGTPLKAEVMSLSSDPAPTNSSSDLCHLDESHTPVFGPITDVHEEPLATPSSLFTFHPVRQYVLEPETSTKISMQCYNPEGQKCTLSEDFICNVAPVGSSVMVATDQTGVGQIYIRNPTDSPQVLPENLPVAFGTTITSYFAERNFPLESEPVEFTASLSPSPPSKMKATQRARPSPEIKKQINEVVSAVPGKFRLALKKLLFRFSHLFAKTKYDLGLIPHARHNIELADRKPAYTKQFTIPEAHREFLITSLQEWRNAGLIKKAFSKYNAPIFVVPKKDGGLRVVLDYRALNAVTMPDRYSIKGIDACLADVGRKKSTIFSTLDLASAFWQMALDEDSQKLTAFTIPGYGQFQWTRGAMGLTGCPASFARIMDIIMDGLDHVICYIDDVLIHSKSPESHLVHLEQAMSRLEANNLKLNLSKCLFLQPSVPYLGYQLSQDGISPGKIKANAVLESQPPTTLRQLQSFLGLCNFFRNFIPNFAMIAGPLYDLTKPTQSKWKLGSMPALAIQAFHKLRLAIGNLPKLAFPASTGSFHLYVDASLGDETTPGGIGSVLLQEQTQSNGKPIKVPLGFASRRLKDAEKRYPIYNLELQAAVYGIDTFQHILYGRPFHLYTDHKPLVTMTKIQQKTLNRLQELLGRHKCTMNYVSSKDNVIADYLSRFTQGSLPDRAPISSITEDINSAFCSSLTASYSPEEIVTAQGNCPQASDIIEKLTSGADNATCMSRTVEFFFKNGMLWAKNKSSGEEKIFVPTSLRHNYMILAHKSVGHGGYDKTIARILPHAFWPDMHADIKLFLPTCGPCAIKQKRNDRAEGKLPISPMRQALHPNERIHMDLYGPLDVDDPSVMKIVANKKEGGIEAVTVRRDKCYVLVMTDALSKLVRLVILPNKTASTVADAFLAEWCHIYGIPKSICTDQGTEFTNDILRHITKQHNIKHFTTSPYHPQSNGSAERFNRTMGEFLRATLTEERLKSCSWPTLISLLQFTYNTSLHRAIKNSPFQIMFGYDPRVPGFHLEDDIRQHLDKLYIEPEKRWSQAKENSETSRNKAVSKSNLDRAFPHFTPGQTVWYFDDHLPAKNPKLEPKWKKAKILYKGSSDTNYFIKLSSGKDRKKCVHVEKLKACTTATEETRDPSFKAPASHTSFHMNLRARPTPQVSAVLGLSPKHAGYSLTSMDLIKMFNAYAAHHLAPPVVSHCFPAPQAIQLPALMPDCANTTRGVLFQPLSPSTSPSLSTHAETSPSSANSTTAPPLSYHSNKSPSPTPSLHTLASTPASPSPPPPSSIPPSPADVILTWRDTPKGREFLKHINSPPGKLRPTFDLATADVRTLQDTVLDLYKEWVHPARPYFSNVEKHADTMRIKLSAQNITANEQRAALGCFISSTCKSITSHAKSEFNAVAYELKREAVQQFENEEFF